MNHDETYIQPPSPIFTDFPRHACEHPENLITIARKPRPRKSRVARKQAARALLIALVYIYIYVLYRGKTALAYILFHARVVCIMRHIYGHRCALFAPVGAFVTRVEARPSKYWLPRAPYISTDWWTKPRARACVCIGPFRSLIRASAVIIRPAERVVGLCSRTRGCVSFFFVEKHEDDDDYDDDDDCKWGVEAYVEVRCIIGFACMDDLVGIVYAVI